MVSNIVWIARITLSVDIAVESSANRYQTEPTAKLCVNVYSILLNFSCTGGFPSRVVLFIFSILGSNFSCVEAFVGSSRPPSRMT